MKKSEAAIHILPKQDMMWYVHEEIKQEPRKMKAKREEEVDSENSLRKKRVKKEEWSQSTVAFTEAYDKPSMLTEVYEQELVTCGVDTMTIKADIEKRFVEQKQGREKKDEEPQMERKDEAEKEYDQRKNIEEVKDDRVDMGIEIWLLTTSNLNEKNVYKKYIKKHIDDGKDVLIIPICHADH
ncbi:uncharacterized protein A4U43_C09F14270 [Asparagus officinalis]|uniref:Uncharacterized protein n=1 Tax=Asparagus officinalis TaxID=4686 RepID=A0A5P1E7K9_ASPOF|nr:uncharacterized protein A4U43_C09F14270 [Asparagus officinalis]